MNGSAGYWFIVILMMVTLANLVTLVEALDNDIQRFYQLARNVTSMANGRYVVDKVQQHRFQEMYGRFLLPHLREVRAQKPGTYRFLEIGAGCAIPQKLKGMQVWDALFDNPGDKIYVAELKVRCIEKMKREGTIPTRINILIGDQGSDVDLDAWIKATGGNLHAIVDDGSHKNHHIYRSLMTLWHALAPGGYYFLEDLQVGRTPAYLDTDNLGKGKSSSDEKGPLYMADVLKDWQEQLMIPKAMRGGGEEGWRYKVLPDLKGIYCQHEACVLMKCGGADDLAKCTT
jgi:hypothetical protein